MSMLWQRCHLDYNKTYQQDIHLECMLYEHSRAEQSRTHQWIDENLNVQPDMLTHEVQMI